MNNVERRSVVAGLAAMPAAAMLGGSAAAQADSKAMAVRRKSRFYGVVYDVGLNYAGNALSVEPFVEKQVDLEIKAIAKSLHVNAVRIEGEPVDRLVLASRLAHRQGLAVFFNPWKMNADAAELKPYYIQAAKAAEMLRKEGVNITLVAGCEYTIFQRGILAGETLNARLAAVGDIFNEGLEKSVEKMRPLSAKVNGILAELVAAIRQEFKGPVSYAALQFEQIDWSIFDTVGIDHYRGEETAEQYIANFAKYREAGKPLVCMEVGSCTYEGAAKLGGGGFMIMEGVNSDGTIRFKGGKAPKRSEREQADYVETQVKLLANNGADGIFVFVFNQSNYPTGTPDRDFDMVSYALVKTFPKTDPRSKDMPPWAPKEAFHRLAGVYAQIGKLKA